MYTACLRCDRSLGANTEIPHLRVGRRIAFDTKRGRLWVICTHCDQWNLTPIEERWEALEECERLATQAEARGSGTHVALAQTESGLELLRVGGMDKADIANWRYARRIGARNSGHLWWLMPLMTLAISAGLSMWRAFHRLEVSLWIAGVLAITLFSLWRKPPSLWTRFDDGTGRTRLLWFWQRPLAYIERTSGDSRPTLVLPRLRGDLRLTGDAAVTALASLLPRINGADCVGVDLGAAIDTVTSAEKGARKQPLKLGRGARRRMREKHQTIPMWREQRPWELVALRMPTAWFLNALPESRLALEMAVTEEVERRQLAERSEVLAEEWQEEEEIGAISDDLILPDGVRERLDEMKKK